MINELANIFCTILSRYVWYGSLGCQLLISTRGMGVCCYKRDMTNNNKTMYNRETDSALVGQKVHFESHIGLPNSLF